MAVSAAKLAAFRAKIETIIDQRDRLATEAVTRAWSLLEDLRRQVSLELTTAGGYDAYHLPRLKAALDQLGKDFAARYADDLAGRIDASWALGSDALGSAAKAADVSLGAFQFDKTALEIVQGMTADLVTKVSAETITAISGQVQRGVLGGQTVFETMTTITDLLGSKGYKMGKYVAEGIASRAETITRTEMLRAYNVANYARAQDAADIVGYHTWSTARDGRVRPSHEMLDGETVKIGEEFLPGLRYPGDPGADAEETINCRCRVIPAFGPNA